MQGVVFTYDPENDTKTKIKDVPDKDVLARIEGNWQDKMYYTLGNQAFAKATVCGVRMNTGHITNSVPGESPSYRPQPTFPCS
jgi:hypothetical protein